MTTTDTESHIGVYLTTKDAREWEAGPLASGKYPMIIKGKDWEFRFFENGKVQVSGRGSGGFTLYASDRNFPGWRSHCLLETLREVGRENYTKASEL